MLREVIVVVLAGGLAGCGSPPSAPSMPVAASQQAPPAAPFRVTGYVLDTANRTLAGASVEVLTGPQTGTSASSDAAGAFSFTGTFDGTTRFRAAKAGHIAAVQSFPSIVTTKAIVFALDVLAGPVNITGDYTLIIMADSACADLPEHVRVRTYVATITPETSGTRPANTALTATLSGAMFDAYYNRIPVFVAGDYVEFNLSDNFLLEEVAADTYLTVGGVGAALVASSGASTISASFQGTLDYCVTKMEPAAENLYTCVPAPAIAHKQCSSKNHRLVLTRR